MTGVDPKKGVRRRKRGFERASSLVAPSVRSVGETRGFAVARLLTNWKEIVGPEVAASARPIEVSYGRGFGATLTLLTTGANAPLLEMQKEAIREKVNSCYGYSAIQKIRLTQTASSGFSEGKVEFETRSTKKDRQEPAVTDKIAKVASGVSDDSLRTALERLGANVISRTKQ